MADISMCANKNCPLSSKCYRQLAKKDHYQSYADFQYVDGNCDYFWDNDKRSKNIV